jgi:hypothetical protein
VIVRTGWFQSLKASTTSCLVAGAINRPLSPGVAVRIECYNVEKLLIGNGEMQKMSVWTYVHALIQSFLCSQSSNGLFHWYQGSVGELVCILGFRCRVIRT